MHADACSTDGLGSIGPPGSHKWLVPTTSFYLLTYLIHQGLDRDELRPDTPMTNSTTSAFEAQLQQTITSPCTRCRIPHHRQTYMGSRSRLLLPNITIH